jgi:hypothetical protein
MLSAGEEGNIMTNQPRWPEWLDQKVLARVHRQEAIRDPDPDEQRRATAAEPMGKTSHFGTGRRSIDG